MSHKISGFFKKAFGDSASYDALAKQPIIDAEMKLNIFKEVTSVSLAAFETYIKSMSKLIDFTLAEKLAECQEIFKKYEDKNELLNPNITHVMGIVFGKLNEVQRGMSAEISELSRNIEKYVLKPLNEYQKDVTIVKENRKELKEAYDKIEQYRQLLEKAKRDVESAHKSASSYSASQASRMSTMGSLSGNGSLAETTTSSKRANDLYKFEEKVQRLERELDEATTNANEKYDKYTEGLYKRVAEECELTNYYLEYLVLQKQYHKKAYKRLDAVIPEVKSSLASYLKKPVFGCPLGEYVLMTNPELRNVAVADQKAHLSPVIRKIVDGMTIQNVFNEEGIFRIAGSRIKMNCLLYAINAGYLDYMDLTKDFDVHCLAGVLKQYIRELPDSILCNDLHDDWIMAINASPQSNKIEAYKEVLRKLPKANYDNIKLLIKFLSKIVENSDKTKMTSQNMGICFGVSLLSSTSVLNNNTSNSTNLNTSSLNNSAMLTSPPMSTTSNSIGNDTMLSSLSSSNKTIDMATATNVFDFLLNNHAELFASSSSSSPSSSNETPRSFSGSTIVNMRSNSNNGSSLYSLNSSASMRHQHHPRKQTQEASSGEAPAFVYNNYDKPQHMNHRYSVLIEDRVTTKPYEQDNQLNSASNNQKTNKYPSTSIFSSGGASATSDGGASLGAASIMASSGSLRSASPNSLTSSVSTSTLTVSHTNANVRNLNRHIKKNSLDSRINENSNEQLFTASNTSLSSNKTNNNNDSSTSGSASPSGRGKKMAPAPPQSTYNGSNNSQQNYGLSSPSDSIFNQSTSTNSESIGSTTAYKSPIDQPSTIINVANGSSQNANDTSISSNSSPLPSPLPLSVTIAAKAHDQVNHASAILEKPNQPPPHIPIRPPPIGFNVTLVDSSSSSSTPYPTMSNISAYNNLVDQFETSLISSTTSSPPINSNLSAFSSATTITPTTTPYKPAPPASTASQPPPQTHTPAPIQQNSLLSTSISSSSSSSQEMLTNSPMNTIIKPPKPAVPPKRINHIVAQINKFEKHNSNQQTTQLVDDYVDSNNDTLGSHNGNGTAPSPKASSEITSL